MGSYQTNSALNALRLQRMDSNLGRPLATTTHPTVQNRIRGAAQSRRLCGLPTGWNTCSLLQPMSTPKQQHLVHASYAMKPWHAGWNRRLLPRERARFGESTTIKPRPQRTCWHEKFRPCAAARPFTGARRWWRQGF